MGTLYQLISKIAYTSLLFFFFIATAVSQRTITGKVVDAETGEGVIGSNVVVKGTGTGTVTDFDGTYSIVVPKGYNILSFSYTGYTTVDVELSDSDVVDVALGQGSILDEVVLIGYGTVKREDATGLVQTVTAEKFNKGAITGAQDLLTGKVAGVVITNSGAPGDGGTIRVRGESSLSASNNPLIVIDGVPIEGGGVNGGRNPLNIINPNDIESFTVLKDASAAAIYGNRASAGVILITTKKGAATGKLRIGYNSLLSVARVSDYIDVLTGDEYRALANRHPDSLKIRPLLGNENTDWQKEIYQTGIGHDQNLYLSGGVAKIPFRVSLGYSDMDGVLRTDEFNRYSAGINLNPGFLNNTLQINMHFKGMWVENHFADRGAIGNALNFDPTHAVRDTAPDNPYGGFTVWELNGGQVPNTIAPFNPVALLELKEDRSDEKRYIANFSADYRIPFIPALRANLNLAYDYHTGDGTVKVPTYAPFAFDIVNGGGVNNEYSHEKKNSLLEFYLNYKRDIGDHSLDLMGGYSWQHFEVDSKFRNSDVAGTPLKTTVDSLNPAEFYLLSFYGRVNYDYNDRWLATFTLRRDGTSRFSPDNRWGLFPAAALAFKVVDNEKQKFNSLKLRLGWGITGQQDIGDYYAYLARYKFSNPNAQYQFGDEFVTTYRPNGYDANIKWEETETYNAGLDFSIIRNRLWGSLELYKRYTTDLLNEIPVPAGTNLTNFIVTNVGNMENEGLELTLSAVPVQIKNLTWDISANMALNHNEITKLRAIDDPDYTGVLTGGISGGVGSNIQIHTVGYAPYSFYVYEQTYDENGKIIEGVFVDRNEDGMINEEDKYRFENPRGDITYGFTSRLQIQNFDFSFAGHGSIGNYMYNNVYTDRGYLGRLYLSTGGPTLWNIHQSGVDDNVYTQANLTFSDYYVQKADFLKLDHITLGYNFNELVGRYLRLSVTMQNVLTLTPYKGLDPEIFGGIDNSIYPRPRTFVFGLNVEF